MFSVTIVVLTLAFRRFGLCLLRNFIRDLGPQADPWSDTDAADLDDRRDVRERWERFVAARAAMTVTPAVPGS